MTLGQLLATCTTGVHPRTMQALVMVESGGNALALHDNTTRFSYEPVDAREAASWAQQLIKMGHSVDLGLAQINSNNLGMTRLSVGRAFDPCSNLRAAGLILGSDYATAVAQFGPGQYALRRALSEYNTGSMFEGQDYINRILEAAGVPPDPTPRPVAAAPGKGKAPKPVKTPTPPYTSTTTDSGVEVINGHP